MTTAFDTVHPPDRAKIDACVHCGFCLPSCPTYVLWHEEMDSPRGRIYLMKAGLDGRVEMDDAFVGHFDACLGCLACVTACPSGVEYGPLIEATRAQIERRHPRGWWDRTFRAALFATIPHPGRLRFLLAPLVVWQPIARLLRSSGILAQLPARIRALVELAPPVTWTGLVSSLPARTPAIGTKRRTVALLIGCVQRFVFSHVNRATTAVLAAEGCDVLVPGRQGCCGALALHAGRREDARAAARRTIEVFDAAGADQIVVNAAGCGSAMKEYADLLADDPAWAARASAFSARVRDVSEVLAELGPPRAERRPLRLRVAYQDACHLAHAQGVRQPPRDLLATIPGVTVVPIAEADLCCGSAGIYNLVQPDPARQLGDRKLRAIQNARADVVATGNPGCALQIAAAAARQGRSIRVVHPVELLAEALGPNSRANGPAAGS